VALTSRSVAFLVPGEGTGHAELLRPWQAVIAGGGRPVLVSPAAGQIQLAGHPDHATMPVDVPVGLADEHDYVGLVLPGGVTSPDQLRADPAAVAFARSFFTAGKPVAVICRGPGALIGAGVVRGRTLTSWPSLQADLENAGATWVDRQVVICAGGQSTLVSSRRPDDLPAFCATFTTVFGEAC
jgi:deglycase